MRRASSFGAGPAKGRKQLDPTQLLESLYERAQRRTGLSHGDVARLLEFFERDAPFSRIQAATGFSIEMIGGVYAMNWRQVLDATIGIRTPWPVAPNPEHPTRILADKIKDYRRLGVRAPDICAYLSLPRQVYDDLVRSTDEREDVRPAESPKRDGLDRPSPVKNES